MTVTIIKDKTRFTLGLREFYQYRDLLYTLAWRDIKVRYAQTFLGLLWAVLQPLATLLIFVLVFGKVARIETGVIPYPVFAICGMSAWSYFSFVMGQSGTSIIHAQNLVQKIYFPRLIIPISKAITGFIEFAVTFVFIIVIMAYYNFMPGITILWLPLFIIVTIICALSVGIWLSALTIRYRDFQHIVPFMVQLGMWVTPVAYPATLVPEKYYFLYYMNPMAGVVEGFRWSLLGTAPPNDWAWLSFSVILVIFISGLYYFRKMERIVADIV